MEYADILLPVPLEGLFTYAVPEGLRQAMAFGVRVKVPFGSRTLTGVAVRLGNTPPQGVAVREIAEVMGGGAAINEKQWELWQWMADYYMSPIGEMLNAALPAKLKEKKDYRPRTETCIRLGRQFHGRRELRTAMDMLARSPRQKACFAWFLRLSGWDTEDVLDGRRPPTDPTREELMNASHASAATVRKLCDGALLQEFSREVSRIGIGGQPDFSKMKALSEAQGTALEQITRSMAEKDVTLLHGVTASGKTEIYIHLMKRAIDEGRQVLFLMPEIALTVQMMERLRRVFGHQIGIYHSRYSDTERAELWMRQLSNSPCDIILGARSAVLLPFRRLGLVIVDEEHEASYKQQDPAPRYHARSAAIMLARMCGAKVLLGTATPSAESYHNALTGKYGLVGLATRHSGMELPEVRVVDVADLRRRKLMDGPLSPQLLESMAEALFDGRQAMLFQNRRGFAPVVECRECGWVPRCEHCDVSLTLHRSLGQLTCHYCGTAYATPTACPKCGSRQFSDRGYGTEKIEECVRKVLPAARVARMDQDTTRTQGAYARLIDDFAEGRTDILIGTQMIGKGLDFGRVAVVGIVDADAMMSLPDFRANEMAFTMMAQVSGRAGRSDKKGLVIIQTRRPDDALIAHVVSNDYGAAYREIAEERRAFGYPPFRRLIYIYLKHQRENVVETAAQHLGQRLRSWFGNRVLGPDSPPVARVRAMFIRKIVLKLEPGIDLPKVRQYLRMAQHEATSAPGCAALQVYFDVEM